MLDERFTVENLDNVWWRKWRCGMKWRNGVEWVTCGRDREGGSSG